MGCSLLKESGFHEVGADPIATPQGYEGAIIAMASERVQSAITHV